MINVPLTTRAQKDAARRAASRLAEAAAIIRMCGGSNGFVGDSEITMLDLAEMVDTVAEELHAASRDSG
jgi:hypothetical protein